MRAMRHGLRSKLPMSLRLIRELHGKLMKGVRGGQDRPGEFRDVQNFIGSPGATIGDARFVPPPPGPMRDCLDAFERRLHAREDDCRFSSSSPSPITSSRQSTHSATAMVVSAACCCRCCSCARSASRNRSCI